MHGPAAVASRAVSPFTKLAIKLLVNTAKNIDKCVRTYIDNLLGHCITLYLHCCNVVHVREVLPR